MSDEHELAAAYRAIYAALADGSGVWGTRVHAYLAPAKIVRPYVVYARAGGGGRRLAQGADGALLTVTVKCTADDLSTALRGAGQISERLSDAEENGSLNTGADWRLLSCTRGVQFDLMELVDGVPIYHAGNVYRVSLERVEHA